jgi:hypothetical protein
MSEVKVSSIIDTRESVSMVQRAPMNYEVVRPSFHAGSDALDLLSRVVSQLLCLPNFSLGKNNTFLLLLLMQTITAWVPPTTRTVAAGTLLFPVSCCTRLPVLEYTSSPVVALPAVAVCNNAPLTRTPAYSRAPVIRTRTISEEGSGTSAARTVTTSVAEKSPRPWQTCCVNPFLRKYI